MIFNVWRKNEIHPIFLMILIYPLGWFYTGHNLMNFLVWLFNFNTFQTNLKTLTFGIQFKNRPCRLFRCSFFSKQCFDNFIFCLNIYMSYLQIFKFIDQIICS